MIVKTRDNMLMPYVQRIWMSPEQIAEAVQRAERALAPDVVRIRQVYKDDWAGDPSIYFKVVLSDDAASKEDQLGKTAWHVSSTIRNEIGVDQEELGLHFYFNFRSLSEVNEMNEPAWA
jgi:hypothetical protein